MTSQNFPWKKGTSHKIRLFIQKTGLTLKKMSFYVQSRSSRPKIDPPCQFQSNFQAEKSFSFSKFLGRLDRKRAAATPLIDQFC